MTPRSRSVSGALLMLIIIPIFAGLLACMPVPIGNPERARVDPDMSGAWLVSLDSDVNFYLLRPYDKRTWLIMGVAPEEGEEAEFELDINTSDDMIEALRKHPISEAGLMPMPNIATYKAWLTKLGGEVFMTWEEAGGMNVDGTYLPDTWMVYKVVKQSRDHFDLYMVNPDHDVFEDIVLPTDYEGDDYPGDMRRTWERALKKHARNKDIYTEDPMVFERVPADLNEQVSELFGDIIEFDTRD